jgi:hypothetical protein
MKLNEEFYVAMLPDGSFVHGQSDYNKNVGLFSTETGAKKALEKVTRYERFYVGSYKLRLAKDEKLEDFQVEAFAKSSAKLTQLELAEIKRVKVVLAE